MYNNCYWTDEWGNCWTYEQVSEWWNNYYGTAYQHNYYDRLQQVSHYLSQQQQMMEQTTMNNVNEVFSIHWNDILVLATQYWWLAAILIVGTITLGIVAWRIFSKNKWVSELLKIWGWKSE